MDLDELIDRDTGAPGAHVGRFTSTATALDDELHVTIAGFDGARHKWGPVEWAPRVDTDGDLVYPSKGDRCLVIFDDAEGGDTGDETPWVIAWSLT